MGAPAVSGSATRRIGPLLAGLALAAGFMVLGAGPVLDMFGLKSAAALAPWDSEVQRRAAIAALGRGDRAEARRLALRSLEAMPFNQSSLTIATLDATGSRAVAAANLAAALGWRDPATNLRLIAAAMNEGAPEIAAQRIDAIGRITEDARRAGAMADELLVTRGGAEALAIRAAHHLGTGWMPGWLATPPASPEVAVARRTFVRLLERDDGAWHRMTIGQAMTGFSAGGDRITAYEVWRETLARPDSFAGTIYDPRFTALGSEPAIGGEWNRAAGQAIGAEPLAGGGLRVDVMAGGSGRVIGQMARFAPGENRLAVDLTGDEPLVRAMRWEIACANSGMLPVTRDLARAGDGWRDGYVFTAPAGCALGYVTLVIGPRLSRDATATVRSVELRPAE